MFCTVFTFYRSSHWRCSLTDVVLRNFAKFTGKHLCQSLFFNKVAVEAWTSFSVTTLALHSFLLKYRSFGSLAFSLKPLINHDKWGKVLSPRVLISVYLEALGAFLVLLIWSLLKQPGILLRLFHGHYICMQ